MHALETWRAMEDKNHCAHNKVAPLNTQNEVVLFFQKFFTHSKIKSSSFIEKKKKKKINHHLSWCEIFARRPHALRRLHSTVKIGDSCGRIWEFWSLNNDATELSLTWRPCSLFAASTKTLSLSKNQSLCNSASATEKGPTRAVETGSRKSGENWRTKKIPWLKLPYALNITNESYLFHAWPPIGKTNQQCTTVQMWYIRPHS